MGGLGDPSQYMKRGMLESSYWEFGIVVGERDVSAVSVELKARLNHGIV